MKKVGPLISIPDLEIPPKDWPLRGSFYGGNCPPGQDFTLAEAAQTLPYKTRRGHIRAGKILKAGTTCQRLEGLWIHEGIWHLPIRLTNSRSNAIYFISESSLIFLPSQEDW